MSRLTSKEYVKRFTDKLRHDLYEMYGCSCECCGEDAVVFLTLDHIAGGGGEHYRRTKDHRKMWTEMRAANDLSLYRVLCRNCNWAYHKEGFCYAHQDC